MGALAFALAVVFTAPALAADHQGAGLTKITLSPQWTPQAQFAGFYAAKDFGVYEKYGLDVTIRHATPTVTSLEYLLDGEAQFATLFLSTGISARAKGAPLVCLAQLSRRSALMIVARKSSGIKEPRDLQGKRLGIWHSGFQSLPRAFLRQYRVEPEIVPFGSGVNLFLCEGLDATVAMWYNEYYQLLGAGMTPDELVVFHLADHGLNTPEDGIYCLEAYREANPDVCRRFVQASIDGWKLAFERPEEALDGVARRMKQAKLQTNRASQRWMLDRMRDILLPNGADAVNSQLTEPVYQKAATILKTDGVIASIPPFNAFYQPVETAAPDTSRANAASVPAEAPALVEARVTVETARASTSSPDAEKDTSHATE